MIFFLRSDTVNLKNYTIKDIPGSSGRLDVISRNILAALLKQGEFSQNTQIWVFLEGYGTYIFDVDKLDYERFPKSEIFLTDQFVDLIENHNKKVVGLEGVKCVQKDIFTALDELNLKGFEFYVLKEQGEDLSNYLKNHKISEQALFLIGNQQGGFVESPRLEKYNFISLSLGPISYLGSSTLRLVKILIKKKP
jgi:tRNA (pseudouridine54-N1)-methyltransferase